MNMASRTASLVVVLLLAVAGCSSEDDSHMSALHRCQHSLERKGYTCIGMVDIDPTPGDEYASKPVTPGKSSFVTRQVDSIWEARGWGRPDDADKISILEDGTLCVKWVNATAEKIEAPREEATKKTSPETGRRLARAMPGNRKSLGSAVDASRRLNFLGGLFGQEPTPSPSGATADDGRFTQELPIPAGVEQIRVPIDQSTKAPFSMVGQVGLGCSGTLVGPCHYLTAGHCVFDPATSQVRTGLDFNPGRNGVDSLFPLGRFQAVQIQPARGWFTSEDPASDMAIVQVQGRPGDTLGTMEMGADGLPDLVALNIAGYPGDQDLGEMWYDYCPGARLPFNSRTRSMVNHECTTTNGNSGSGMWTLTPDGKRTIAAVHTSQRISASFDGGFISIDAQPGGSFVYGTLLEEMRAAIADMECDAT